MRREALIARGQLDAEHRRSLARECWACRRLAFHDLALRRPQLGDLAVRRQVHVVPPNLDRQRRRGEVLQQVQGYLGLKELFARCVECDICAALRAALGRFDLAKLAPTDHLLRHHDLIMVEERKSSVDEGAQHLGDASGLFEVDSEAEHVAQFDRTQACAAAADVEVLHGLDDQLDGERAGGVALPADDGRLGRDRHPVLHLAKKYVPDAD